MLESKLEELPEWKLGWIAGILDGEGCISVRRPTKGKHYSGGIRVANTDEDMIASLSSATGLGKMHKRLLQNPKHKPMHRWNVYSSHDIVLLLCKVSPYMVTKRKQALLLLKYCTLKIAGVECHAEFYYASLKELNKKGLE